MSDRRYQVFISSTFRDLTVERQAVLLAIQRLNHIPVGMELFPSANIAPWDVIERIVNSSDYYVLIVGGRYGSTDENGISFTEREYDLAISTRIPVLAFLHAEPERLTVANSDINSDARSKLEAFKEKVKSKHHCAHWLNPDELAGKVVIGLVNEIAQNPRPGWVRGDFADDRQTLLATVESVRRENDVLRAKNEQLATSLAKADSETICQGNDTVTLRLHRRVELDKSSTTESDEVPTTWHAIFMALAWEAASGATGDAIKRVIAKTYGERYFMDDEIWRTIATQLLAVDLIMVRQEMRPSTFDGVMGMLRKREATPNQEPTDIWQLSEKGVRLFATVNAIKRD